MYDAGIFLKNYVDFVEELPNDIQKCITKCREVDCKTKNLVTEVEKICEHILTAPDSRKSSTKMQQILVKITELKDEKLNLTLSLSAHIENKYKTVADSYQVERDKQEPSPTVVVNTPSANSTKLQNQSNTITTGNSTSVTADSQEKSTKRIRKTRIDNLEVDSTDDNLPPPSKSTEKLVQSTSSGNKRGSNANSAKKAKKRKTTKKQNSQISQESIDEVIQDDGITDETTYCICQQISYGEMIFCENDTCPIEWFHFSCVDLTAKPKGRWFCPNCRGEKPNVINKNLRKKQQESSI